MERRRIYTLGALAGGIAITVLVAGKSPKTAAANMRVPADPNEVLEVLASPGSAKSDAGTTITADDPRSQEIASLKKTLEQNPQNLRAATRLARIDIQLARETSDPRYLGYAQAALSPWWLQTAEETTPVPGAVLVLRATIEQSLHDFDSALRHLDRVLAATPDDMQAWLTRATILTVLSRYTEAKTSCERVRESVARTVCETQIESLTGHAKDAHERLAARIVDADGESVVSPDEKEWAISSLGEYAARFGDRPLAEAHFKAALAIVPTDAYARGALGDLLIDGGRFTEAAQLLAGHENDDGMLLRLAIAERLGGVPGAAAHIKMLEERFEASRARGDVVHRREEARFWLSLKDDPVRALDLAKANWQVQREPWDARIFLASANAAKSKEAASPVIAWLDENKLEDPAIGALR